MARTWIVALAGLAGLVGVAGCIALSPNSSLPAPVGSAFRDPDEVILYSLAPEPLTSSGAELFHGFAVRGKTEVKDDAIRKKLFKAFVRGTQDHDGSVAVCFIPHHGLRIRNGKQTTDLVICFLCAQARIYDGANANKYEDVLISKSPRPAFNEVLKAAKLPFDAGE
jgi:hypothetical protein